MEFAVSFVAEIVHACCRLHNMCIDARVPIVHYPDNTPPAEFQTDEEGRLPQSFYRNLTFAFDGTGGSIGNPLREIILDEIERQGLEVRRNYS
jgi:hypothetical protein